MRANFTGTLVAGLAVLFSPVYACAHEKPVAILARLNTSFTQREVDRATCRRIVEKAPGRDRPAVSSSFPSAAGAPNLPAVAGVAIVDLVFLLIDSGRAQTAAEAFCMANLGYAAVPLSDAEKSTFLALPENRRAAWEERFLAQDLTARLVELQKPLVPPLPAYRDEIATIGGLRFHLGGFAPAAGPVGEGATVLTGKVDRWRTAVLAADFATLPGVISVAGKAGAVFHQVDYRQQRDVLLRDQGATWCGEVEQRANGANPAPAVYCFGSHREGYTVFHPTGFAWLAGPQGEGFVLSMLTSPLVLEERPDDDLGLLDFNLTIAAATPTAATLEGIVMHNGQRVRIWRRRLKLAADGHITVPLWQRRLVLTPVRALHQDQPATQPEPARFTVAIDDNGDGKSLRDGW